MMAPQNGSHVPSPPLIPARSLACTSPVPLLTPSLCALSPLMPQELPPTPHRHCHCYLHLHNFTPGGEKKEGTALMGQEDASWHSPASLSETRSLSEHTRRTQGLQGAVVCSIMTATSGWTQSMGSYSPQNVAAPRAPLLPPWAGRAGCHAYHLIGTQLPGATISVPPFPGTEPVSPTSSAAGCRGSERHRGRRWGHQAHCRQGTACLTTMSPRTAPAEVLGELGHAAGRSGAGREEGWLGPHWA